MKEYDVYYVTCLCWLNIAAIARQIYLKPGMGVGGLKIRFGGSNRWVFKLDWYVCL